MLSEKHYGWILAKNPEVCLKKTKVRFRPYSTGEVVPLLGACEVRLTNSQNKSIKTEVFVVEGEGESLLGKQDAIDLGSSNSTHREMLRDETTTKNPTG